jgi:Asp-tRNA(Asn)/Glu-tRNA(Gln) amidotransferase A subunit family amidase
MIDTYTARITAALEKATQDVWGCLTEVTSDRALRRAADLDSSSAQGLSLPLAGIPFVAKNLFDVKGIPSLAGGPPSPLLKSAASDALLIRQLEVLGAILIGAAQMDEYALGFLGDNPHYGSVINPDDAGAYSGGSSSGSAAAVSAGIVPFAIGTDTNGSVRVPASFCGVFSLKPTYGSLPLDGSAPLAPSLDHAGLIAASLSMLERVWQALPAARSQAPATRDHISPGFASIDSLRIARRSVQLGIAECRTSWPNAPDITLPDYEESLAAASIITSYEAAWRHADRVHQHPELYSSALQQRIEAASRLTRESYELAKRVQRVIRVELIEQFEAKDVDVIVAPVAPVASIARSEHSVTLDHVTLAAGDAAGLFTRPFSLAGFPVLTLPASNRPYSRLPKTALQLIALPGQETVLFRFAKSLVGIPSV